MSPEDREKAIRAANTRHRALVGRPQDGRELTAIATTVDAVLARPVEITDEQREQIVVAIQDHVMPRLARPTSAEAGALREAVNRALSAALSPAEPVRDDGRSPDAVFAMECAGYMTDEAEPKPMEIIWTCKIGGPGILEGTGRDFPMRRAIERAYREITGYEPAFIFSGWGAELTEPQRAVVEDRFPRCPTCELPFDKRTGNCPTCGGAEQAERGESQ